jgi:hypothetical protein
MGQGAAVLFCPKGHASSEADYCSECGAKIQGAGTAPPPPRASAAGDACPDCGTVREQAEVVFCEVCGYNFVTGAHGEVPIAEPVASPLPSAPPVPDPPPETQTDAGVGAQTWTVLVAVDPALRSPESPEPPADFAAQPVPVQAPVSLIGRRNEARGIFPEISLDHDEAVSRRHALLQVDPQRGLLLRDIGAANGTRLNGKDLEPMVDYPLHDGDEITLGHWTRIRVQANHG